MPRIMTRRVATDRAEAGHLWPLHRWEPVYLSGGAASVPPSAAPAKLLSAIGQLIRRTVHGY